MVADRTLSLVVFRYCKEIDDTKNDAINEAILAKINKSGKAYITHTKVNNRYVLRVVTGQTNVKIQHIEKLWAMIQESSKSI